MSKVEELLALAARVEAAEGADRELDADIAIAIRWSPPGIDERLFFNEEIRPLYAYRVPPFTASLDAAASLVPEGCLMMLKTLWDGPVAHGFARITSYRRDPSDCEGMRYISDHEGLSETPALALTAAALRAIAHQEPKP